MRRAAASATGAGILNADIEIISGIHKGKRVAGIADPGYTRGYTWLGDHSFSACWVLEVFRGGYLESMLCPWLG